MRSIKIIISIYVSLFFQSYTSSLKNNTLVSCDDIPSLNKQVIDYVKTKIKKKVGRGECWDLAAEALNTIGADWDKNYKFGKEINLKNECVYPGDIIQFEGIEIEYKKGNMSYSESMDHHTAIIYEVKDKESFILAEQNTGNYGKKVGLNPLELKNIRKGKYKIFRPVK